MNEKHPQQEQESTEGWVFKQRSVLDPIGILQASCSNREESVGDSTLICRPGITQEKASLLSLCLEMQVRCLHNKKWATTVSSHVDYEHRRRITP